VSLELGGDDFLVIYLNRSGFPASSDLFLNQLNFMTGNLTLKAAAARVVWVLDPADGPINMTISLLNFVGTVLAPTANFRIQNAVLNGRAYVRSLHSETPHRISNSALMLPACSCGEAATVSAARVARRMQITRQRDTPNQEKGESAMDRRPSSFSEVLKTWELGSAALFSQGGDAEVPSIRVKALSSPVAASAVATGGSDSAESDSARIEDELDGRLIPKTLTERLREWELAVTGLFSNRQ